MMLSATAIDSPTNPWVFVAWFGCLCGIYFFGQGLLLLRTRQRKNTIANIHDAQPGPISVAGRIECAGTPNGTLNAPLSGKPCFYYRATAWRQEEPASDNSWEIVAEETQGKPFILNDLPGNEGSGNTTSENHQPGRNELQNRELRNYKSILVDPHGAHVDLPRDTHEEYGKTLLATFTDIPPSLESFLKRNKVGTSAALRVEECLLPPGAEIFVHGIAIANPELAKSASRSPRERRKHPREVSVKSASTLPNPQAPQVIQLSPEPAHRPAAEMTMQSRVAAALNLARAKSPEPAPNPLHIPSISVVAETQARAEVQAPAPTSPQPMPPALIVRQQDGSRFTISYRNLPTPTPSSLRRALAFLTAGPLLTAASAYALLTILGVL
jgi:hypothetical protein